MRALLTVLICAALLASGASPVRGQCPSGSVLPSDAIELHLMGKPLAATSPKPAKGPEKIVAERAYNEAIAETPLAVAPATQVEAPSGAMGGSEVSLPGLASLLALAQEQGLVNSKDGVSTVSLTPFSFVALLDRRYLSDQELYVSDLARTLRSIGGTVSFGGKGDKFDRNGDGQPDDALEAKDFNDIVTWEAKYQFGSRDRRDRENFEAYDNGIIAAGLDVKVLPAFGGVVTAVDSALQKHQQLGSGCYSVVDLESVFKEPQVVTSLNTLRQFDEEHKAIAEEIFNRVDRKPILTLVFGGTERGESFGPDKRMAALRSGFTRLGGTNAVELSWSEVENLLGVRDAATWKLGWQYSRSFLKGSVLSKDGVTLAVAGTYEMLDDVPMAKHDEIGKLNAKFSVPVSEGVTIPISVTWANHKDLLTDEEEVRGHIGFTVDYSAVRDQFVKKAKGGS
jgi:hypothetical protein